MTCSRENLMQSAERLVEQHDLPDEALAALIEYRTPELIQFLGTAANRIRLQQYGNRIFIRGLIEFSNYCRNNCYYCGIRRGNEKADRYRLTKEQILACCKEGYRLGFRTFVLQSGEDLWYTDERLEEIVRAIRSAYPDCAITLSLGERSAESYRRLFEAGADRYLLREETADAEHYRRLHPPELSFEHRMNCLYELRQIGYQVGCGFMVGTPGEKPEHLVRDLRFIKEFQPQMVGIGPFLPHADTPFRAEKKGSVELTLLLLSILRIMLPGLLLPATTALGTAAGDGRERGILAGANVVMPNLSPVSVRKKYMLYDKKICTGEESAQCIVCMGHRIGSVGSEIVTDRGDSLIPGWKDRRKQTQEADIDSKCGKQCRRQLQEANR